MTKEIAGFKFIHKGFVSGFATDEMEAAFSGVETSVTRQVEAFEVPRDIRKLAMQGKQQELVQLIEKKDDLDVPEFMKDYKKRRPVVKPITKESNVIEGNFGKKKQPGFIDAADEAICKGVKKLFRPLKRYFIDGDDIKDVLKGGDK